MGGVKMGRGGEGWFVFSFFFSFQCQRPPQVDPTLLSSAPTIFSLPSSSPGRVYAPDFGARKMQRDMQILRMSKEELTSAWEGCVRAGMRAKVGVEDELGKGVRANVSCSCSCFAGDWSPLSFRS